MEKNVEETKVEETKVTEKSCKRQRVQTDPFPAKWWPRSIIWVRFDQQYLTRAIQFAIYHHDGERRKNPQALPYVTHPLSLLYMLQMPVNMDRLTRYGFSEEDKIEIQAACVLHDVIENTPWLTQEEFADNFSTKMYDLIMSLSDDKSLSKVARKKAELEHSKNLSKKAAIVKLLDKVDNIEGMITNPPREWDRQEINGYIFWAVAICRNLRGILPWVDFHLSELLLQKGSPFEILGPIEEDHLLMMLVNDYFQFLEKKECRGGK